MTRAYAYPPELADYVLDHWPQGQELGLSREAFSEALSTCFHASMTAEEGRPTRFRLLLTPRDRLPEGGVPNQGVLRLTFEESRALSADELRRLSPAAPFETTLITAHLDEHEKLRIWGIAHSGPAWLAPTWGGRSLVPTWTVDPIIHVNGPGHVAVRRAGKLIGAIERGVLVDAAMDVFESDWLPEMFAQEREEIRRAHSVLQAKAEVPTEVEHSLVGTVSQHMLRRAIQLIRSERHGGMILIAGQLPQAVHVKYRLRDDEPARRYRSVLFRLLDLLSASTTKPSVGWTDFEQDRSPELEKVEQSIFEVSRLIAGLAAIDGAVVLNKSLDLIGFGAEVSPELASPARVWRALDLEGQRRELDAIESVGTRHRAAYRFVWDHPRGLAIVISHDGAVRFVANREGNVVYFEQPLSP